MFAVVRGLLRYPLHGGFRIFQSGQEIPKPDEFRSNQLILRSLGVVAKVIIDFPWL